MKRKFYLLIMLSVILSTVTGCVTNPINAYTGGRYYDYGVQASKAGDWELARQNFYRAYVNAQIGHLGPAVEAYCIYEWARVTGYLGMYADAEKGFGDVLSRIDKARGKADKLRPPALCELSRLLHDTGQHLKAIPVYERALSELEKVAAEKDDPMAFADFLDDYGESLRFAGYDSRADEVLRRAATVREANKGLSARFIAKRYNAEANALANGE